jgi:8-amino-7-oxononanoate synthase
MDFEVHIRETLAELERAALLRTPRPIVGPQGATLTVQGRPAIGLCSNNYLGLAGDPRLIAATVDALHALGAGSGASRHISGTSVVHREAERRLAAFVRQPAALLFSTGYATNVGTIPALVRAGDAVFSDELNHASLIDGCRLSRAAVHVYRHGDLEHLEQLLAEHRPRARAALVLTESIFSMDGDAAPLVGLRALCDRHRCGLLVDDAHALGVLGPEGRGLCSRENVVPDLLVGTLSKAFGCSGGFVAGSRDAIALIENRARSYVFSTAPFPALAATAIAATDLVESAADRRAAVLRHASTLRTGLRALGYRVLEGDCAIVPVVIGEAEATMAMSAALLERGVFVHGVRPPTVPPGTSRLRVTPMATHSDAQIAAALEAFAALRKLT